MSSNDSGYRATFPVDCPRIAPPPATPSHRSVFKLPVLPYNRTTFPSRDGGTGRRSGLKIRRPSGLGGSTPPPGTIPPYFVINRIRRFVFEPDHFLPSAISSLCLILCL